MNPILKSLRAVILLSTRVHPMSKFVSPMDRKVLRRRIDAEGVPFPCVTLPTLGKALEAALETGVWSTPPGFGNQPGNGRPLLLQAAFNVLIDEKCCVRSDVDDKLAADAVLTIRQVTLACGKCDIGTMDRAHVEQAWSAFKANQERLRAHVGQYDSACTIPGPIPGIAIPVTNILRSAKRFIARALAEFDPANMLPAHGPGASANRVPPPRRYSVASHVYNWEVDRLMPYSDFLFSGAYHLARDYRALQNMPEVDEFSDKATFVPKDCTKVRGISVIHSTPMYFGQAVASEVTAAMNKSPFRHEFDILDQERNKSLACEASRFKTHATVDLQDASDSLSKELVYFLFPDRVAEYLHAVRSVKTAFEGEEVRYACWAPMGHPTCFPVQTLVFWALSKAVSNIYARGCKTVSVYGDDIIIPTDAYKPLCDLLHILGLKVNRHKSFANGFFRESCGGDYYAGHDVSIVRCKKPPIPRWVTGVHYADSTLRYTDLYGRLITRYGISVYEPAFDSILRIVNAEAMGPVLTVPVESFISAESWAGFNILPCDLLPPGWFVPRHRCKAEQAYYVRALVNKPVTTRLAPRGERVALSEGPVYRVDTGWSLLLRHFCTSRDDGWVQRTGTLLPGGDVLKHPAHGRSVYAPRGFTAVARQDVFVRHTPALGVLAR